MSPLVCSLPGRLVRRHLDRLQASLQTLGERLREVVARTVGEAVADAVRALVALLASSPTAPLPALPNTDELWEEPDPLLWHDPYRPLRDDHAEELLGEDDAPPMSADSGETTGAARWSQAVSAGCRAAAWWLRRQAGRCPLRTSVVLGVAVALAAFVAGPVLTWTGAGVLGAALALIH
jgi:hypothetical protein